MRHGGSFAKNGRTWRRFSCRRTTTLPSAAMPCTWKTDLAISRPIVVTACMFGSSDSWSPQQQPRPWHSRAGGRSRPQHQQRTHALQQITSMEKGGTAAGKRSQKAHGGSKAEEVKEEGQLARAGTGK